MKIFSKSHDGGKDSGVTGYWLIEWKSLFSIVLLKFSHKHRENYHSHAFNAYTWWLKGKVVEEFPDPLKGSLTWVPSLKPKFTPRKNIHKIVVTEDAYALSIRGPWDDTWVEVSPKGDVTTLTHNRVVVK